MRNTPYDKSKIIVEIIEYDPDSVLHRTVIRKHTGLVNTSSMDIKTAYRKKSATHDQFAQLVDGRAYIQMNDTDQMLTPGQGILIPSGQAYSIYSDEHFKLIMTVVKPE